MAWRTSDSAECSRIGQGGENCKVPQSGVAKLKEIELKIGIVRDASEHKVGARQRRIARAEDEAGSGPGAARRGSRDGASGQQRGWRSRISVWGDRKSVV